MEPLTEVCRGSLQMSGVALVWIMGTTEVITLAEARPKFLGRELQVVSAMASTAHPPVPLIARVVFP